MSRLFILFLLSLAGTGCSPLPWRGADMEPPGFSLTARQTTIRPGSLLTLPEAIRIARAGNPQTVAARYLEQQAKAVRMQALSPALPQVKLSGRAARYRDPQRVASPSATNPTATSVSSEDLGTWDAVVTLNLFAGGRDVWNFRMAQDLVGAARLDAQQLERTVTTLVIAAYYQAVWRRAVAGALHASARALEAETVRVRTLLAHDKASLLDVTRVQVRAAEVMDQARAEDAQAELALLQLFHLLGLSAVPVKLEPPAEDPVGSVPSDDQLAWKEILARRPDLKAARLRISSQRAKVTTVEAELWPTLALAGSFGQRVDISGWPVEDGHWRNSGYLGLEMAWSPFEGGRIHYLVQQETAALRVMIENLRALELSAVLEIRTTLARLRSARDRLETARESLTLARTSLELEKKKVELGQSTFTDFQLIESSFLDAQVRVLQLMAEVRIAWYQFRLATGEL
ncbi:TolC family protein [Myxococcota bacterium]|nr:TolC family protein [Myxococcota bacterium]MBU1410016.1 TolC family protein [Myxococcota bacterium]MBU1509367.1 TolC family protein [Myxococcota bacterium]